MNDINKVLLFLLIIPVVLIACNKSIERVEIVVDTSGIYPGNEIRYENGKAKSFASIREMYTSNEWDSLNSIGLSNMEFAQYDFIDLPHALNWFQIVGVKTRKEIVIEGSPKLESLDLRESNYRKLILTGAFPALRIFHLSQTNLQYFPEIECALKEDEPDALNTTTYDFGTSFVANFSNIKENPKLLYLRVGASGKSIKGVEQFKNLKWLVLTQYKEEQKWGITVQTRRIIQAMDKLVDINAITSMKKLEYIQINGAPKLKDFSPVFNSVGLTNLWLEDCPLLTAIDLSKLAKLRALCAINCNISDTSFLLTCTSKLSYLLLEVNKIKVVRGLAHALIPASEMRNYMPKKDEMKEPNFTIDLSAVEIITKEDLEYIRNCGLLFPRESSLS